MATGVRLSKRATRPVAIKGARAPPNTPANWKPSDAPVTRTRVANSSGRNEASGENMKDTSTMPTKEPEITTMMSDMTPTA